MFNAHCTPLGRCLICRILWYISRSIHVWLIYLHLVDVYSKCGLTHQLILPWSQGQYPSTQPWRTSLTLPSSHAPAWWNRPRQLCIWSMRLGAVVKKHMPRCSRYEIFTILFSYIWRKNLIVHVSKYSIHGAFSGMVGWLMWPYHIFGFRCVWVF